MPSGVADGALIIDTGLDNKGFIRDAAQFKRAVETLTQAVNKGGQQMGRSMGGYLKALQQAGGASRDAAKGQSALEKEIARTEAAIARLNERQAKMKALAEQRAAEQRQQLRDQMIEETKAAIGHGNWEIMPKWSQDQAIEQTMRDFEGRLKAIQAQPVENTNAWRSLQYDIDQSKQKLEALNAALAQTQSETPVETVAAPAAQVAEAIAQPVQAAEAGMEKLQRLMNDWSATMNENSWSENAINDENAMLGITRYINNQIHEREQAYQSAVAAIDNAKEAAQIEEGIHGHINGLLAQREQKYQATIAKIEAAEQAMHREREAAARTNRFASALSSAFAGIAQTAWKAAGAVAKIAGNGALSFLKKLAAGAKNAAIQLAKLAGRAVVTGLKKIGQLAGGAAKKLFGLGDAAKGGGDGFKHSLKNLMRYGLGIRSLFFLFNKLRTAVKEGFDVMAGTDARVAAALASLKGALGGLKGSLSAAFAPILTAVAPALTTLINLLTQAVNAIGMFFAAITGQGYFMAAKGMDSVGSAAGSASGSVKELKRQLAGFDELNILSAGNSGGGGSGGGGGSSGGYSYEKLPVAGFIADFADQLKALVAVEDWDGLGGLFAAKINGAFEKANRLISWDNLGAKITKIVDAVAGTFNSFVSKIKWEKIGETFATGANTFVKAATQALTKFDFPALAASLTRGLNSFISHVEWRDLGRLIAKYAGTVVKSLLAALTTIEWADAGKAFADAVNGLFDDQSLFTAAGDTISTAITGFFEWSASFLDNFDAIQAAEDIKTMLGRIKWGEIASGFWATAKAAFKKGGDFLKVILGGDVYDVQGDAVEQMWERGSGNASSKSYAKTLLGTIGEAVKSAIGQLNNLFKGVNWYQMGQDFKAGLDEIDWSGIKDKFFELVGTLFDGLGDFIAGALMEDLLNKDNLLTKLTELIAPGSVEQMRKITKALGGPQKVRELQKGVEKGGTVIEADEVTVSSGSGPIQVTSGNGKTTGSSFFGRTFEGVERSVQGTAQTVQTAAQTLAQGIKEYLLGGDLGAGEESLTKAPRSFMDEVYNIFTHRAYGDEADLLDPELIKRNQKAVEANTKATKEDTKATDQTTANRQAFARSGGDLNGWDEAFNGDMSGVVVNAGVNFHPLGAGGTSFINKPLEWLQKVFAPGTDSKNRIELVKKIAGQTPATLFETSKVLGVFASLFKKNNKETPSWLFGTGLSVLASLFKKDNKENPGWLFGTALGVFSSLFKKNDKENPGWLYGTALSVLSSLFKKDSKETPSWLYGTALSVLSTLAKKPGSKDTDDLYKKNIDVTATIKKAKNNEISWTVTQSQVAGNKLVMMAKAMGGIITAGGRSLDWWGSATKYASGTNRAHGTMFVAGEAGPEIVGHVNGRTEILNQSQLAQTMRSAVASGMLAALNGITFTMPAMATGGVMPYEVSAQIAKSTADIQGTLNANNEDLIQTIISVAGQLVAAVGRIQPGQSAGGMTAQQVIDEINRRTLMFGASPLKGV